MPDDRTKADDKDKIVEFIIEDADQPMDAKFADEEDQRNQFMDSLTKLQHHHFSILPRLLSAFFMIICSLVTAVILIVFMIFLACTWVTFRNFPLVNNITRILWIMTKKAVVFSLGFLVGIFSPAFGIGIIIFYFTLVGEHMDKEILAHVLGR